MESLRTIDLGNGRRATCELVGEGEPMLVFVGGPGLAATFMRPDAELLAERFTCFLVDPHGSGGSSPPVDSSAYDNVGHARFYEEVRRALGLGTVSLLGHSFGGTVALTYAALFPEVVSRCIAVCAFAMGVEVDATVSGEAASEMERALARHSESSWYPEARKLWDEWTDRVLATDQADEVEWMLATVLPLYCAHPDRPEIRVRLDQAKALIRIDLAAAKAWEGGLYQGIDLRPVLERVKVPTLVITGELDLIGGPAQARAIHQALVGSELAVIPDCGHNPSWESPETYRKLILDWVGGRP